MNTLHELGIVIEVINTVERFAKENNVEKIDTLVLQIGEMSSMIPKYVKSVYPAAVDGTILKDTKLKIEILPANAICLECNKVYNFINHKGKCPNCKSEKRDIISGKEFFIKEILCC